MTTKEQPEDSERRFLRRWFTVVVLAVVIYAVVLILRPLAIAIVWAAFLAFLMQPLQKKYSKRFKSANRAAGMLTALTPLAVLAPLTLLGFAFAQQIAALLAEFQANSASFSMQSWSDPQAHPRIAGVAEWLHATFSISTEQLQQWAITGTQNALRLLGALSGQMFLGAAGSLLGFFLMLFILFFMLRNGRGWFWRVAKLTPLEPERRMALFDRLARVIRAVVYGAGLTAVAQGLLVGIGFAIAGLPGPVVFGVVATVSALLPFGGAALVWVPAVLYLLAVQRYGTAIFMLAWGVVVSVSDNFIRPFIISRQTPVPTLVVFLGVLGGIAAFGLIGIVAGPVILVLATEIFSFAEESLGETDPD